MDRILNPDPMPKEVVDRINEHIRRMKTEALIRGEQPRAIIILGEEKPGPFPVIDYGVPAGLIAPGRN